MIPFNFIVCFKIGVVDRQLPQLDVHIGFDFLIGQKSSKGKIDYELGTRVCQTYCCKGTWPQVEIFDIQF